MSLEYVRFDAAPQLTSHTIDVRDAALSSFISDEPLQDYIEQLQVTHPPLPDPCAKVLHALA